MFYNMRNTYVLTINFDGIIKITKKQIDFDNLYF